VDRVSSYLSGRHFIAEDVNATPTIFGPFALAITFALCGHDNDRFDPVEAPQQCIGPPRVSGTGPALLVNFRLDRA
jgi:hypothetical protein